MELGRNSESHMGPHEEAQKVFCITTTINRSKAYLYFCSIIDIESCCRVINSVCFGCSA